MNNKDNQLLAEVYNKVISESIIQDPAINQALGEIMSFLAVIAAAGAPAIISQIKDELKQKAAKAQSEQQAKSSITNRTISPEEQKAQLDAKAPAFQRQQVQQQAPTQ